MTSPPSHRIPRAFQRFAVPTPLPGHIEEFQRLYHSRFGVQLSTAEALEQLTHLVAIVQYKRDNAHYQFLLKSAGTARQKTL